MIILTIYNTPRNDEFKWLIIPKKLVSKSSLKTYTTFTQITRRIFTVKFKTKVVLEALKEKSSLVELAQRFDLHPQQISNWKRKILNSTEDVFRG